MFSSKFSRKSWLTPQKTVSFKVYQLEQKSKLQAYYPFLSADQIKNKIRDQWQHLNKEERSKYTKVILKTTPTKENQSTKKAVKTYEQKFKRKKDIDNKQSKKQKIEECGTPEFINTERLHDFRLKHTEHYNNDFSDSPAPQHSQVEAPVCDWNRKGMATYQNIRYCVERVTPEIVDDTPSKQTGILKNRDRGQQAGIKSQVSFCSPVDVYQLSDVYSDTFSDSDTDGLLLRRNDAGSDLLQTAAVGIDSDDEDDETALLITRQEQDYETEDMAIDEKCPLQNQKSNDNKHQDSTEELEKNISKPSKRKLKEQYGVKETKRAKKALSEQETDQEVMSVENDTISNLLDTSKAGTASSAGEQAVDRGKENVEVFKSPLTDTGRLTRNRSSRKRTRADKKSAEVTTPVGSTGRLNQLVTPIVPQNINTGDSYTTPLMDEVIQQLTLQAASKAPQKKKQGVPSTSDLEKLRVLTAGRRVTRSLIAAKEAIKKQSPKHFPQPQDCKAGLIDIVTHKEQSDDLENACSEMDPSGDARCANRQSTEHEKGQTKLENHSIPNIMGHSEEEKQSDITPDLVNESYSVPMDKTTAILRSETTENMFCHRSSGHQDEAIRSVSEDSSSGSQISEESSSSPVTTMNTNPILEKALRNLQCTASDSPKLFTEQMATRSSPGLLSPALSGVSELSSASSPLLMDHDGDKDSITEENQRTAELLRPQDTSATKQLDLCQMFKDLTPPEQKTKGAYKTQRLLQSNSRESKNFTQMFHEGDDSLFF